jgi:hypothetical protein
MAGDAGGGEYSGAVCYSATPPSHGAAIAVVIDLSVREDSRSLRRAETPLGAALATSTQGRHVPLRTAGCTGSQTPRTRPDIVRVMRARPWWLGKVRRCRQLAPKKPSIEPADRRLAGVKLALWSGCGTAAVESNVYLIRRPPHRGFSVRRDRRGSTAWSIVSLSETR